MVINQVFIEIALAVLPQCKSKTPLMRNKQTKLGSAEMYIDTADIMS